MKKRIVSFLSSSLNGMAYGLFATLIIGTIISTIGSIFANWSNSFCEFMINILGSLDTNKGISFILKNITGFGIGIGIALALKFDVIKTITLGLVGEIAALASKTDKGFPIIGSSFTVGDPLLIYVVLVVTALAFIYIYKKKTSVDIILIPLFGAFIGTLITLVAYYPTWAITFVIRWLISEGTTLLPLLMGIVVAVLMGIALTSPISSAAIAAIIFTTSSTNEGLALASGAAIVGCSTQMIGFAIQSIRDNKVGSVVSVGIGTSMLQFKNIIKKPIIWLPTIIASAILGPISTCVFKIKCMGVSCGMGSAGLVGQIGTYASMGNSWQTWVGIFGLEILAPAILVFVIDLLFRKFNLIKKGDFSLSEE